MSKGEVMKIKKAYSGKSRQTGMALIVVVVLLLLASLIIFFSVNFGILTQRSSGNDLRSRLVQQTADSALAEAAETVLATPGIFVDSGSWVACTKDDEQFPCGVIPEARRASMYRFNAGTGSTGLFSDSSMEARMLNLGNRITSQNNTALNKTDGFQVRYGVGAIMCRLEPSIIRDVPVCSTDPTDKTRMYAVTLVAVAEIPNEGARATATRSFATRPSFGFGPGMPTLTLSGAANLSGTMQIVAAQTQAGPVSVWTRDTIPNGGTPNTCTSHGFYSSKPADAYYYSGGSSASILRCDDCECPEVDGTNPEALTTAQGNQACKGGGDLVIGTITNCGLNDEIDPTLAEEFPCDVFEYVFGVAAYKDVSTGTDNYCETKLMEGSIGRDEAFLLERADVIITSDNFGGRLDLTDTDRVKTSCASMVGVSGLVWDRAGLCANVSILGTPGAPVLLVYDGKNPYSTPLIGLLFVRRTDAGDFPEDDNGADFQIASNLAIYGSVVVQGRVKAANGTSTVVHNTDVLTNLANNLNRAEIIPLPGSWSDNVRY